MYSGLQSPGFLILQAKNPWIPDSLTWGDFKLQDKRLRAVYLKNLPGQEPGVKEKSSIAMSPWKLTPVIPSNVICQSKTLRS